MADKSRFEQEFTEAEIDAFSGRVVDPGVFNKTVILQGLAGYKMIRINTQVIIQNRALSLARYLGLSADNHLDGQNGCQ